MSYIGTVRKTGCDSVSGRFCRGNADIMLGRIPEAKRLRVFLCGKGFPRILFPKKKEEFSCKLDRPQGAGKRRKRK